LFTFCREIRDFRFQLAVGGFQLLCGLGMNVINIIETLSLSSDTTHLKNPDILVYEGLV